MKSRLKDSILVNGVIYFDIGATLGEVTAQAGVPKLRLFSNSGEVLETLKVDHLLGIISNTGGFSVAAVDGMLQEAGVYGNFSTKLMIYTSVVKLTKDSPFIFELALGRAAHVGGVLPPRCRFVGEQIAERKFAENAGFGSTQSPDEAGINISPFVSPR